MLYAYAIIIYLQIQNIFMKINYDKYINNYNEYWDRISNFLIIKYKNFLVENNYQKCLR